MFRFFPAIVLLLASVPAASASVQTLICTTTAVPLIMHAEEITEPIGELRVDCTGAPASTELLENVTIQTNLPITNRIDDHRATDAVFSVNTGSGFATVSTPGVLGASAHTLVWNGVHLNTGPDGSITLRFSNIRVDATEAQPSPGGTVLANLIVAGNAIAVNHASLLVGTTYSSLYSNSSSVLICTQAGSSVPDGLHFSDFVAAHAAFSTTRLTEAFASVLASKADQQNFNADSGHRILIRYTGLSPAATLYVPVAVTGSDAVEPTAGGDFGLPASGGKYQSSLADGSLLLSLVHGADANGAGGTPLYVPPAPPSAVVTLDTLAEIPVSADGSAEIVYEVMDSSDNTLEMAQFPTFLSVPPTGNGLTYTSSEEVTLAPVSTVLTASTTAPVPRFVETEAPNDCPVVGDCDANYFGHMVLSTDSLDLSTPSGLTTNAHVKVMNTGQGQINWGTTIVYDNNSGPGWLTLSPSTWPGPATVNVIADATNLAPGTWKATIMFDAGPIAGTGSVSVTLTVGPSPGPSISTVTSSANFDGPVTAGSLGTIIGIGFTAPTTVTFDGLPAEILFANGRQINFMVPASLAGHPSTQLVISNNGVPMAPVTVPIAPFSPGIFPGAILNQDNTVNSAASPAHVNTAIQVFGTGIAPGGVVTALISGDTYIPEYAGPAPGLDGVQQVNVRIPSLFPGSYFFQLCESGLIPRVCSPPVWLVVGP